MIHGKAKADFGRGDILVTPLCREDRSKCAVVLRNHERRTIGSRTTTDGFEILEDDTVLTFTNEKSIDVLIDALFEAKLLMRGSLTSEKKIYVEY